MSCGETLSFQYPTYRPTYKPTPEYVAPDYGQVQTYHGYPYDQQAPAYPADPQPHYPADTHVDPKPQYPADSHVYPQPNNDAYPKPYAAVEPQPHYPADPKPYYPAGTQAYPQPNSGAYPQPYDYGYSSNEYAGTNKWYLRNFYQYGQHYNDQFCVRDCAPGSALDNDPTSQCGGIVQVSWVNTFTTLDACCNSKLSWIDIDLCRSNSNPSQIGSHKYWGGKSYCLNALF